MPHEGMVVLLRWGQNKNLRWTQLRAHPRENEKATAEIGIIAFGVGIPTAATFPRSRQNEFLRRISMTAGVSETATRHPTRIDQQARRV